MIREIWPGVWIATWKTGDGPTVDVERLSKHEAWQALIESVANIKKGKEE